MGIASKKTRGQRTAAEVAQEATDEELIDRIAEGVAAEAGDEVIADDVKAEVETAVTEAIEVAVEEIIEEFAEEEADDAAADPAAAERAKGKRSASPAAPRAGAALTGQRAAQIVRIATRNGLSPEFAARHIERGTSPTAIRSAIVEARASQAAAPISAVRARITRDEGDTTRHQAEAAVYSLIASTRARDEDVGAFRGMSLVGIARRSLGHQASGRSDREVVQIALRSGLHSSSDFSFTSATGGAIERRVREIFTSLEMPLQPLIRDTLVSDFRPVATYSIGGFPELKEVAEGAEYEAGSVLTEAGEFKISKFGRLLNLTFESIVNDDLRLLDTAIRGAAARGVTLRNKAVRNAFNAKLSDGKALFHASRGNLINDVLSVDGLSKARALLRKVADIDGDPMGLTPKFLIVGADLETDAQRLITPITAAISGEVNPFASSMTLIVDPMLNGKDWIVAADPSYGDAIELADLRGYEGVRVDEVPNPLIDGISYRARTFAGAHPTGWRGFVKSTGTGA